MTDALGVGVTRLRQWATSGVGFAWIASWALLAVVLFANSPGQFALDIKPEVYLAPWRTAELFAVPWQTSPQLGWASFNVGLAPVPAAVAALHLLGVEPEMSSRVLRLVLLTIAALGAALLMRVLGPGRGRSWVGYLAGVLVVANPYTVVGGSTLAVLLPLALLPWMLIAVVKAVWHGGWRWPAVAALSFAAMSGMNAGVIPLLQLVAVPFVAWWAAGERGVPAGAALRALARTALGVVLLSLYWIVPTLSGAAFGVSVVQNSETLEGINAVSSLPEVLRGLGMWPMYGSDSAGPWQPGFAPYLLNPAVVVGSFAMLTATLWALFRVPRRMARAFGGMTLTAAVLMVGIYPVDGPAPTGAALRWLFTEVPLTGAFRTLNKEGSVLLIGALVLVCAGAATLHPRTWSLPERAGAAVLAGALIVLGVWPALTGGLYPRILPIPDYWSQAAADIDASRTYSRVWMVPGEVQEDYTWATAQPDDIALPLFARRTILRTVLPIASPSGANLLYGLDSRLQAGELLPGTMSLFARKLSAGDIVVRNDTDWIPPLGGRPWTIRGQLEGDPGLGRPVSWGRPGQNVLRVDDLAGQGERTLAPVVDYPVPLAQPIVRAQSLVGALLVAGDGASMTTVAEAGLMPQDQTFLYLHDLSERQFADLLGPQRRLVLTDGNRRVDVLPARLTRATSALLPATAVPASTRALGDPEDQTVLVVDGGSVEITPARAGAESGASPEFAFDGDPASVWQWGGFGASSNATATVRFPTPRDVGTISIDQAALGPVTANHVVVTAGDRVVEAALRPDGPTPVTVDARDVTSMSVHFDSVAGNGVNGIAVREIAIPGFTLERGARLPTTLDRLSSQLTAAGRAALATTPLDVVLRRETGGDAFLAPEERTLVRDFTLPQARTFRPGGLVRVGPVVPDDDGCLTVATIDGRPLRMRMVEQPAAGAAALMTSCGTISLTDGPHRLRPVEWVLIDRLTLRDVQGEVIVPPGPVPWVSVAESAGPRYDVDVAATLEPVLLVAGEAADPRWTWSGPAGSPQPTVVDGGLNGWFLPAGPTVSGVIAFGPQVRDQAAGIVSGATAAVLLVLAVPLLWRRRPPPPLAAEPNLRRRSVVDIVGPGLVLAVMLGPAAGLGVVVAGVVWWRTRRWRPLAMTAVVGSLLVPAAWLGLNFQRMGAVSGELVSGAHPAHLLASAVLGVAVMGQVARGRLESVDCEDGRVAASTEVKT